MEMNYQCTCVFLKQSPDVKKHRFQKMIKTTLTHTQWLQEKQRQYQSLLELMKVEIIKKK